MSLLKGKSALITGASRGIGREIALEYARQGANVAFSYNASKDAALALEAEITAMGVQCLAIQADGADMLASERMVAETLARFGAIDILVNNAGITRDNLLLRMTAEQFDEVIRTNLNSVFYATKAVLKPMLKQRSGSIINITSVVGLTGNAGQANYSASKAGMIGFTKSTAKEIGSRGIRANCVAPGFIESDMTQKIPEAEMQNWLKNIPLQRPGKGADVAALCVFLGSNMSEYITGQVLQVDGGMVM